MIGFKKFFNLIKRVIWPNKNHAGHRLTSIESANSRKAPNVAKVNGTICPATPLKKPTPAFEGYLVSDQGNRFRIISASTEEQLREHLRFIAKRPVSIDFYAEKVSNSRETFENLKQASLSGSFVLNAVSSVTGNGSEIAGVEVRPVFKPPVHTPAQAGAPVLSPSTRPQSEVEIAEALAREASVPNPSPVSKSGELVSSSPTSELMHSLEISPILELETEQSLVDEAIEDVEKFAVSPEIMVTDDDKPGSSFCSSPMRALDSESEEWFYPPAAPKILLSLETGPAVDAETEQSVTDETLEAIEPCTVLPELMIADDEEAVPLCSSLPMGALDSESEEWIYPPVPPEIVLPLETGPVVELETLRGVTGETIPAIEKWALSPEKLVADAERAVLLPRSLPMRLAISEYKEWLYPSVESEILLPVEIGPVVELETLRSAKGETIPAIEKWALSLEKIIADAEKAVLIPSSVTESSRLLMIDEPERAIAPMQEETWTQHLTDGLQAYTEVGDVSVSLEDTEVEKVTEEAAVSPSQSAVSEFETFVEAKCPQLAITPNRSSLDYQQSTEGDGLVVVEPPACQPTGDALTDLTGIVDQALLSLTERERKVLTLRYGLSTNDPIPLGEIASELTVTPARVSQIRKTAVEEVKQNQGFSRAKQVLEEIKDLIWSSLAETKAYIPKQLSEKKLRELLPGELNLVIACFYGSITGWLRANACESTEFWYKTNYSVTALQEIISKLENEVEDLPLPRPLQSLSDQVECDKDLLELAVQLDGSRIIYEDYLTDVVSLHTIRTIELHRLLIERRPRTIVATAELMTEYNRMRSNHCSRSDLEMTLSAAPHLFVKVGDTGWSAIGAGNAILGIQESRGEKHDRSDSASDVGNAEGPPASYGTEKSGIVSIIRDYLKRNGPSRFSDLTVHLKTLAGRGDSANGFSKILENPGGEFMLLAAGLYGLWEQIGCRLSNKALIKQLLTPHACKRYVLARYAGEKADAYYPRWLYAMQREWCIWAEREAEPELFESLLYISEPSSWPVSEHDRSVWISKREHRAFYRFESSPGEVGASRLPSLTDILVLLRYLNKYEHINWMRTNCLLGLPLVYKGSACHLAILIGLGALSPADNWQRLHRAGPALARIDLLLSSELHRKGDMNWNTELGKQLLEEMRTSKYNGANLGWVNQYRLENIVERIFSLDVGEGTTYLETSDSFETPELDAVFNEYKHAKTILKFDSLINSLTETLN